MATTTIVVTQATPQGVISVASADQPGWGFTVAAGVEQVQELVAKLKAVLEVDLTMS